MEQRILDMWPKYEDGSYVWFCDAYSDAECRDKEVEVIEFDSKRVYIAGHKGLCTRFIPGERVKRPAPKVLDADGVEIKVGDTVWHEDGTMLRVDGFGGIEDGETIVNVHVIRGATPWREVRSLSLTHTRPDSWERLKADAADIVAKIALHLGDYSPSDFEERGDGVQDRILCLVSRAKALADREAGR